MIWPQPGIGLVTDLSTQVNLARTSTWVKQIDFVGALRSLVPDGCMYNGTSKLDTGYCHHTKPTGGGGGNGSYNAASGSLVLPQSLRFPGQPSGKEETLLQRQRRTNTGKRRRFLLLRLRLRLTLINSQCGLHPLPAYSMHSHPSPEPESNAIHGDTLYTPITYSYQGALYATPLKSAARLRWHSRGFPTSRRGYRFSE